MATKFYANQAHATLADALLGIGEFFCSSTTGPGWTLLGAYSDNNAAFEAPVAANSLTALPAGNGWKEGVLVAGDYLVFAANAATAGSFQVGFEYQASTTWRMILAPNGGFNTGGAVADMTDAGNWPSGKDATLDFDITGTVASGRYTVKADADHAWIKYWDNMDFSVMRSTYIGNPEDTITTDAHPALMYYNINYTSAADNGGYARHQDSVYRRISPVDNTTEIEVGCSNFPNNWVSWLTDSVNYTRDKTSGEWNLYPIYLQNAGADHRCKGGKLRGVYMAYKGIGYMGHGTFANKTYAWHKNADPNWAALVTEWDGSTALGN